MKRYFYIAAAICIVVGLALCAAAFAVVRGDLSKLSTVPPYEEKKVSYPAGEWSKLSLVDRNASVRLERSADDQIHLTYYENAWEKYRLTTTGGELGLEKVEQGSWIDRLGIRFNFQDTSVVIALPENYIGDVSVETTNASIDVENLSFSDALTLKTTNSTIQAGTLECAGRLRMETTNGGIALEDVTAAEIEGKTTNASVGAVRVHTKGDFSLTTTNGGLSLEGVTSNEISAQSSNHSVQASNVITQGHFQMSTTNGALRLERVLPGRSAELVTTNGSICGSLLGEREQYAIESHTTNASNNLPQNSSGGPKSLLARTKNGRIEIDFVD